MPQRYRLHLSDGTVLIVDHDSLSTWLVDRKATVQVEGSSQWYSLYEFLAAERASAGRASPRRTAKTREELPLIPPPPRKSEKEPAQEDEPPAGEAVPPPDDPVKSIALGEPVAQVPAVEPGPIAEPPVVRHPGVQLLAEEPVVPVRKPVAQPTPDDSAPPIPLDDVAPAHAVPLGKESRAPRVLAADPFAPEDPTRAAAATYEEEFPVIPLKPLQDEERAGGSLWSGRDEEHGVAVGFGDVAEVGVTLHPADVAFLRAMAALGGFLSRLLDSLARHERRQRSRRASARSVSAGPRHADAPRAADVPRTLGELLAAGEPRAADKPEAANEPRTFGEPLAVDEPRPPPAVSAALDLPMAPRPASPPAPALKPPPSLSELPVLRLAETHEPESVGDVYEAADGSDGSRFLPVVWMWTKRLAVVTVLVGGGILAAHTWETWFPKAGELGQQALTGIDRQVRSGEIASARQRALQEGIEQLPQLAPETIKLVLTSSPSGVLDVLDLFRAATDAADRGRSSLTPEEALEMDALRNALLEGLHPAEREHVREYDRTRRSGAVFPSEERAVLVLLARGARMLPPERLERFQTLLGRATVAGLVLPGDSVVRQKAAR